LHHGQHRSLVMAALKVPPIVPTSKLAQQHCTISKCYCCSGRGINDACCGHSEVLAMAVALQVQLLLAVHQIQWPVVLWVQC